MSEEEKNDIAKVLQRLGEAVSQIGSRLSGIEERLDRIENTNRQGYSVIQNTRTVAEGQGELGGESLSRSANGGIERVARIPVCDICGTMLDGNFTVCGCGKKVCEKHAIRLGSRNLCVECLTNTVPLAKRPYKVLVAIANGINGIFSSYRTARLARIDREDVNAAMRELARLGLITKRGWFIFRRNEATDIGINAIGVFRKVYGEDEDVALFDIDLRSYLEGR